MIELVLIPLFLVLIFLHLSWIILYFLPARPVPSTGYAPSVTIILPAHNEESVIGESVKHCLDAAYPNEKEVIVVNDGSSDKTGDIVKTISDSDPRVRLITLKHAGKANAINAALAEAKGEVVVVVDADSRLENDALIKLVAPFADERIGAVSGVIRASMNNNPLVWFQDVEYIMSSTWRYLCNKINATYLLPGFTAFRRSALLEVGGFKTDTLSEDFDIGLCLRKAGYKMEMVRALMFTHVPQDIPSLVKQRIRWSRGTLQVVKKHSDVPLNLQYGAIGLYAIPTQLYWFIHGFISIPITAYQVLYGYMTYFARYNDFFSYGVLNYFLGWFSLWGMFNYSLQTFTGVYPMTDVFLLSFTSFALGTLYTILSIIPQSGISWKHLLVVLFYFPYSIFSLFIFMIPLFPEILSFGEKKKLMNVWGK
jgi:cellulose synthase/poly-beta-1,6-N-acetylglucosamine synthase-like glycosyltransferase